MTTRNIAGKYELEEPIGRGAMGEIWEALDLHLRRRVALKLMSAELGASSTARIRFDREARAIAQLRNQHVVQIYDYGIDGESPYIVMELLEGEDLESRLARMQRMPLSTLIPIVSQTAIALAAAHAKGIVHRDLKPANVFLARGEAEDIVKILDFGVVTMLATGESPLADDVELTAAGSAVGTPLYMSPEQIRDAPIDHRSDLWSLGVLAYRSLVGNLPFSSPSIGNLMVRICTDSFPPPTSLVPGLPSETDRFFERALAKDPAQRFSSAKEMASAFAALGDGAARGPAKLLVVDDEADIPILIQQRFRQQIRRGVFEFVFAANGQEALEQLSRHPDISVVVSDISMPVMDGLTLLSRVPDVNPLVRTIIVSAYGDMTNIRTAMNLGAFDFLVKPIDFKDLSVTIEKTLKHVQDLRRTARSNEENNILRTFVSPGLLARLRDRDQIRAIEVCPGTIVVIDVVGVESLPPNTTPSERIQTLNANFEVIVPAVANRGGLVDKFVGSGLVAVFRNDAHVTRALEACLDLRIQLRALALRAGEGSPFGLGVSIGVATGDLLMGEIGSKASGRLDFAVVGQVPRTAGTLQLAAGRNRILVDPGAFQLARDSFHFVAADAAHVPGGAFELLRRSPSEAAQSRRTAEPISLPDEITIEFNRE